LAPTEEILEGFQKKKFSRQDYERKLKEVLARRNPIQCFLYSLHKKGSSYQSGMESMIKLFSIVCGLILFCASSGIAETIDVYIKGVDDGVKTSKQQDYKEAVMHAKLQAIELTGASIESIVRAVNFQLKYDATESKSNAILLPDFQIIDIGYVVNGTYQVVLIGKIQVEGMVTQAREIHKDGLFITYDNRTILDTGTGLMWAAKDNGADINWKKAKSYCENYRGGGYTDWRMPTQDELAGLYDKSETYSSGRGNDVHLTKLIRLTGSAPWASETSGSEAASFDFHNGTRGWSPPSYSAYYRALPVRSGKDEDEFFIMDRASPLIRKKK
jgi:hypothetical protein